jgi:hypothetical protein
LGLCLIAGIQADINKKGDRAHKTPQVIPRPNKSPLGKPQPWQGRALVGGGVGHGPDSKVSDGNQMNRGIAGEGVDNDGKCAVACYRHGAFLKEPFFSEDNSKEIPNLQI